MLTISTTKIGATSANSMIGLPSLFRTSRRSANACLYERSGVVLDIKGRRHMSREAPTLMLSLGNVTPAAAQLDAVVASILAVPFIVMLSATKRRQDCP